MRYTMIVMRIPKILPIERPIEASELEKASTKEAPSKTPLREGEEAAKPGLSPDALLPDGLPPIPPLPAVDRESGETLVQ